MEAEGGRWRDGKRKGRRIHAASVRCPILSLISSRMKVWREGRRGRGGWGDYFVSQRICVCVHIRRLIICGLQIEKQLDRYCSVSVIMGSRAVWRKRCFLIPYVLLHQ